MKQQSIAGYAHQVARQTPIPPVTKGGIQEHMLAIVATCDLVRTQRHPSLIHADDFQPFRFVERPAVRGLITYLNPKLRDDDIPKKSAMAAAVYAKVAQLENVTMEIVDVRIITYLLYFCH